MKKKFFQNAQFFRAVFKADKLLHTSFPEVAFIGRSNVGKSSLINAVLNKRGLAKISSTPGKTRSINYILLDGKYFLVDLPGYGFAKIPDKLRQQWRDLIESYIKKAERLEMIGVLIDSRHDLQAIDIQALNWLDHLNRPYFIVLTKTDKLSANELSRRIQYFRQQFPNHHVFPFSIKRRDYIISLQRFIYTILTQRK